MRTTTCVVFDDDPDVLPTRERQADRALGDLVRRGTVELCGDIIGVRTRWDFLQAVVGSESCLAIADMHGRRPHSGNIGARLLRAVSDHARCARTTKRILWTQHDHPEIAQDMAPYVHAIAHYSPADHGPLTAAIEHALHGAPESAPRTFPPVRDVSSWEHELRHRLIRLTGDAVLPGDERIALEPYHRVPQKKIDAELDRASDTPHRKTVNHLLHAICDAGHADSIGEAHEVLSEEVAPVAQQRARDRLHPSVVTAADQALDLLRDYGADERREHTWLTDTLDRITRPFIKCFKAQPSQKNAPLFAAVETALRDAGYCRLRDDLGLTDADLTYALWTLADTKRSMLTER